MRRILLGVSLMLVTILAYGQGATTSGMNGKVVDPSGEPIVGATVIAVNKVTGAQYGNITDVTGYFRIPNMKVGGPYEVTVSFVGFTDFTQSDIYLTLGKTFNLNVSLQEGVQELSELVVTAGAGDIMDANRTGAATNINSKQLNSLPNASREINDFVRLTPQASFTSGGGISIAGTNNRYNSIFIDGATSNDVFGLAGNGQNGGQVDGLSLISIDALEQLSVQVAPYDVTLGGFAGGGISAVTRSGTNEFSGSVYYFVRNDRLSGKTPGFIERSILENDPFFEPERLDQFSAKTMGVRLGGPIIKDKLFFFFNVENQMDEIPTPFNFDSYTGSVTQQQLTDLISTLDGLGYDPGGYENTVAKLEAQKFLVKLDWNIDDTHKLTVRHSYNKGESFSPATSNTSRIRFANAGIYFPSTTNSTTLELNSNFKKFSNKLILGYTTVEDNRDPLGNPFPYVDISTGDVELGSEQFSTGNFLEQKIFTITDNFTIYKGRHTITVGTHNEFYDMNNVFIRQNFGSYRYNTIADFIADVNGGSGLAFEYNRSYSLVDDVTGDGTKAAALFKATQLGFYAQDEIQVNNKLKVNIGVRVDIPMFNDDPVDDGYFNETAAPLIEDAGYDLKGAQAGKAPDAQLMWAPRLGFNYDLNGDGSTQIRGGVGIFTSRVPFVWPGAMYNNNGASVGGFRARSSSGDVIDFEEDPFNQPTKGTFPGPSGGTDDIPQGQMDLFAKDFKFPQVFRANIGVDQELPVWGLIATGEVIYTQTINNIFYENVNLVPSNETFTGADNRPIFSGDEIDPSYSAVYLGSNTNEGYTVNYTIGLTKPAEKGFGGSLFYNYGSAFAIFEGTSSQNSSQWRGVYSVDGRNVAPLGRSDFDAGSRIIGTVSYRKEYGGIFGTTISMVYNGQSGQVFSYTYDDGFTGEDSRERALIYVPNSQAEIVFDESNWTSDEQWAAFSDYIARDSYLKDRRGKYAEKNEIRTPFQSIVDFRLLQDIFVETGGKRNTIQLSLDIFNFGNMLNRDWGRRYFVPNGDGTSVQLLTYEGTDVDGTTPTFSFDPSIKDKKDLLGKDDSGLISSRWQMQLGIRYIFN
jgi:hypothetical protein